MSDVFIPEYPEKLFLFSYNNQQVEQYVSASTSPIKIGCVSNSISYSFYLYTILSGNSYYNWSYNEWLNITNTTTGPNTGTILYYSFAFNVSSITVNSDITIYSSANEMISGIDNGNWNAYPTLYPITYRLTNATTTGPNEAAVGDTVTIPLTFPEGYGVVNPSSDAYVTCNGIVIPSTYSNGQLVFTMPDPS